MNNYKPRWFDTIFGGRKHFYGVIAAVFGLVAFFRIPVEKALEALPYLLTYWLACLVSVHASNVIQKIKMNGGENGNGKQ